MATDIIYETHSITMDNRVGVSGWSQSALSEEGRRCAAQLGASRRDSSIAAVFDSDLHRAVTPEDLL